jgi:type IX secretion system substrate protein
MEINVNRFEIELAKGNAALQQSQFVKIGEVAAHGNSSTLQTYTFTDLENNKSGIRYYRLKIIDNDGNFSYSLIRPVLFNDELVWSVNPNPSSGLFNLICQSEQGKTIDVKVYDMNGKLVKQINVPATGFVQKIGVMLDNRSAAGLYLMEIRTGDKLHSFKLLRQ